MNPDAWRARSVLITGHTGFKGAWLTRWLRLLGATVHGLALEPPTEPNLHALIGDPDGPGDDVDLREEDAVVARVAASAPEVVFHLAARSLVRPSFAEPAGTFAVNVLGTAHLLDAVRACPSVRAVVVVTSDKVYAPHADGRPHTEDDPLGGTDPYSSSKAAQELVAAAYRASYLADAGVAMATARAGNVIGGGDWAVDRVVPDVLRARTAGEPVALRHPDAVRPWQHVLDPLHGYLLLAERLLDGVGGAPTALNFGPDPTDSRTVAELVDRCTTAFGGAPGWSADGDTPSVPETAALRLDASRAHAALGWSPRLGVDDAVDWTVAWHLAQERGDDPGVSTDHQIAEFEERA